MSYERLTPHDLIETINMPTNGDLTRFIGYAMRLHELENAIEKGEYQKLPCKVGDTIYYVGQKMGEFGIEEFIVKSINITDDGVCVNVDNGFFYSYRFGVICFTDKAQAEQRLALLKGEIV